SGSVGPPSRHSAMLILVFSGTLYPACSAIHVAGLPSTAELSFAPPLLAQFAVTPKINSSIMAFSFLLAKYTP
ncbi:hypothetical protein ACTHT3_20660, partial [Neisseria sp. P0015.S004]